MVSSNGSPILPSFSTKTEKDDRLFFLLFCFYHTKGGLMSPFTEFFFFFFFFFFF